ncbi:MAG: glycosyltransferase [bacterium]|nr:glycosyltransferase [bacterium]
MEESSSRKRVIVVSPADSFFTDPHVRAFQALGFDCIAFDNRSGAIYSSPFLRRAMRVFPKLRIIKRITLDQTNKKLLHLVKSYQPHLIFGVKAENIYPQTITKIRQMGAKTICFYIDLMDHWPVISQLAPAYDLFFNQDRLVVNRLRRELSLTNSFYMAHSAEPLPDALTNRINKYDISFIGTHNNQTYPNRERYLKEIGDLDLNIWGTDGWKTSPLAGCFRGRSFGDQRFEIYGHSKIVIDINWDVMPAEGLSNRPFEVTGSGACFFVDLIREDIKRCYEEGKEFVSFSDEKDLREKVRYYLEHDEERERIARAGYQKTVERHTYVNRVRQLLDIMEHPEKF